MNSRSNRSHCLTDVFIELPGQAALQSIINAHKDKALSERARIRTKGAKGEGEGEGKEETEEVDFPGLAGLQKEMESDREYTVMGRITLVDLAGSENMKRTNSQGKTAVQEAGFINKSLYVLGQVIQGLSKTGDANHRDVPFRDSKLTKLLISSLGGRSRTLLLACIAESSGSTTETLRTLKFSMTCARIKNRPIRFLDPQKKLIMDLRGEIKRLRMENAELRQGVITTAPSAIRPSPQKKIKGGKGGSDGDDIDEEELFGLVKPLRRAASANPSLAPMQAREREGDKDKESRGRSKKRVVSSASESRLGPSDRSGSRSKSRAGTRGKSRSRSRSAARNGVDAGESLSTTGKKKKKKKKKVAKEELRVSRSPARSRAGGREREREKTTHTDSGYNPKNKKDRQLARNMNLHTKQLERVMAKKGGVSRNVNLQKLRPIGGSNNGSKSGLSVGQGQGGSYYDYDEDDGANVNMDDDDDSVTRIRMLEARIRKIEGENGLASSLSSEVLGDINDTPPPQKKGNKRGNNNSGGGREPVKKLTPQLKNIKMDPSLQDLLLLADGSGGDSDSDDGDGGSKGQHERGRKLARNVRNDNSSLSINSGGRFSNVRSSSRTSRSVTRGERGSVTRKSKTAARRNPNQEDSPRDRSSRGGSRQVQGQRAYTSPVKKSNLRSPREGGNGNNNNNNNPKAAAANAKQRRYDPRWKREVGGAPFANSPPSKSQPGNNSKDEKNNNNSYDHNDWDNVKIKRGDADAGGGGGSPGSKAGGGGKKRHNPKKEKSTATNNHKSANASSPYVSHLEKQEKSINRSPEKEKEIAILKQKIERGNTTKAKTVNQLLDNMTRARIENIEAIRRNSLGGDTESEDHPYRENGLTANAKNNNNNNANNASKKGQKPSVDLDYDTKKFQVCKVFILIYILIYIHIYTHTYTLIYTYTHLNTR